MRCPFPGMDPWLEHPAIWPGVHTRLIGAVADELQSMIGPRYFVDVEERVYLVEPEARSFLGKPDVVVSGVKPFYAPSKRATESTGISIAEYVDTDVELVTEEDELTFRHLEIHDVETRELVTVIELLSPTNKLHPRGRTKYLEKRWSYFEADVNFIEIDLLRDGGRMPVGENTPLSDYAILIVRKERLPRGTLRSFNLRRPIPPLPVPLRLGEAEPILELNAVLHSLYERARYDLRIDYNRPTEPPLNESDAAWAADLVREATRSPSS